MCVCVRARVCVCVCVIHTCIDTHTRVMYTHTHTHTRVCVCVCVYMYMYVHVYIYIGGHGDVRTPADAGGRNASRRILHQQLFHALTEPVRRRLPQRRHPWANARYNQLW